MLVEVGAVVLDGPGGSGVEVFVAGGGKNGNGADGSCNR